MKFTKQEQALIKLAAAHMAPQMLKKATLQDKLAEYGIGLRKQAAEAQPRPAIGKPMPTTEDRTLRKGSPMQLFSGRDAGDYPYLYRRGMAGLHRSSLGSHANPVADARIFDNKLDELQRLHSLANNGGSVNSQDLVDVARAHQAQELAGRVARPDTNRRAYDDAVKMLIQAGRNNQKGFELDGDIPFGLRSKNRKAIERTDKGAVPYGYKGYNSLTKEQLDKLLEYYPVMGSTGNFRRFSNLS